MIEPEIFSFSLNPLTQNLLYIPLTQGSGYGINNIWLGPRNNTART